MLSSDDRKRAAARLISAAADRKQAEQLSKTWPSIGFDDAYAIQSEVIRQRVATGGFNLMLHICMNGMQVIQFCQSFTNAFLIGYYYYTMKY